MKKIIITILVGIMLCLPSFVKATETVEVSDGYDFFTYFNGSSDKIINLTKDISLEGRTWEESVQLNSNITINLNGHKIINGYDDPIILTVINDKTLTINGTTSGSASEGIKYSVEGGKLIINGGTYTNQYDKVVYMEQNASSEISNATMSTSGDCIVISALAETNLTLTNDKISSTATESATLYINGTATINGGDFKSTNNIAVYVGDNGKLTVNSLDNNIPTFNSPAGAVLFLKGNAIINSGKFYSASSNAVYIFSGELTVNASSGNVPEFTSDSTDTATLYIAGTATIEGGKFTASSENVIENSNTGDLTINNGTFIGKSNKYSTIYDDGTTTINGGTFSSENYNTIYVAHSNKILTINDTNKPTFLNTSSDYLLKIEDGTATSFGEVKINGGTYTSENYNAIYAGDYSKLEINNATINSICGSEAITSADTATYTCDSAKVIEKYIQKSVTFKVTYILDGKTYKDIKVGGTDGVSVDTNLLVPTEDGYTFSGWYYNKDLSSDQKMTGTKYSDIGFLYTTETYMCSATGNDITFYGKMTKNATSGNNSSSGSTSKKENSDTGAFVGTSVLLITAAGTGILYYVKKKKKFLKY